MPHMMGPHQTADQSVEDDEHVVAAHGAVQKRGSHRKQQGGFRVEDNPHQHGAGGEGQHVGVDRRINSRKSALQSAENEKGQLHERQKADQKASHKQQIAAPAQVLANIACPEQMDAPQHEKHADKDAGADAHPAPVGVAGAIGLDLLDLFLADPIALANEHLPLLHPVEHRSHSFGRLHPAVFRLVLVESEVGRCHAQQNGQQRFDQFRRHLLVTAQNLDKTLVVSVEIDHILEIGFEGFSVGTQIAHHNPLIRIRKEQLQIADDRSA